MKKELWLFTRQFPEGRGEAFLESALPVWCSLFERVRIFPMFRGAGSVRLPDGVEVCHLWDDVHRTIGPWQSMAQLPAILSAMRDRTGGWNMDLSTFRVSLSHARQLRFRAERLSEQLRDKDPGSLALLSVWMEDWVSVLGSARINGRSFPFATMAHGWDLYAHRRSDGSIPYREAQLEQVSRVLCIAEHGASYLRERYAAQAHKVQVCHLGTTDHGLGAWHPSDTIRIASSAYLRPPKRFDRMVEALHQVQRPVHWVHFGDGPDLAALKERAGTLPDHVQVDWRGAVPNSIVLGHFQDHPVDLFVLLSDDEGVPVSLMEAASFGIPLLASDVGGVGEVVTPGSGRLVPRDIRPDVLAATIVDMASVQGADVDFRAGVRSFWDHHFRASTNFTAIARAL
jgi:glycosyltransferase involved in cell wall biosynthesis